MNVDQMRFSVNLFRLLKKSTLYQNVEILVFTFHDELRQVILVDDFRDAF